MHKIYKIPIYIIIFCEKWKFSRKLVLFVRFCKDFSRKAKINFCRENANTKTLVSTPFNGRDLRKCTWLGGRPRRCVQAALSWTAKTYAAESQGADSGSGTSACLMGQVQPMPMCPYFNWFCQYVYLGEDSIMRPIFQHRFQNENIKNIKAITICKCVF